jgi:ribosomal protein S14
MELQLHAAGGHSARIQEFIVKLHVDLHFSPDHKYMATCSKKMRPSHVVTQSCSHSGSPVKLMSSCYSCRAELRQVSNQSHNSRAIAQKKTQLCNHSHCR